MKYTIENTKPKREKIFKCDAPIVRFIYNDETLFAIESMHYATQFVSQLNKVMTPVITFDNNEYYGEHVQTLYEQLNHNYLKTYYIIKLDKR